MRQQTSTSIVSGGHTDAGFGTIEVVEFLVEAGVILMVLAFSAILSAAVLRSIANQGGGESTTTCEVVHPAP